MPNNPPPRTTTLRNLLDTAYVKTRDAIQTLLEDAKFLRDIGPAKALAKARANLRSAEPAPLGTTR